MRLHWHPFSILPRRVRIALAEKGIEVEDVMVDLPAGAQHEPAFRALNPFGQVPVLEDGDLVIAESIAILEYVEERFPDPALLPRGPGARALCRQWMLFSGDYLNDAWKQWMAPFFDPRVDRDADSVHEGRRRISHHLDVVEARLAVRDWLVDEYSLADVCYAPVVTVLGRVGLGDLLATRPFVAGWIARLEARPAVAATAPPMLDLAEVPVMPQVGASAKAKP